MNSGVFIRAFECRAFSPKYPANPNYEVERVMQNWNQGGFERCVHKQTKPARAAAHLLLATRPSHQVLREPLWLAY